MCGKLSPRVLTLLSKSGFEPRILIKLEDTYIISSKRYWIVLSDFRSSKLFYIFKIRVLLTSVPGALVKEANIIIFALKVV